MESIQDALLYPNKKEEHFVCDLQITLLDSQINLLDSQNRSGGKMGHS